MGNVGELQMIMMISLWQLQRSMGNFIMMAFNGQFEGIARIIPGIMANVCEL